MASKVLYDTRNNQIMRCQPEPRGSAFMPHFEALCKSARIPENEKEYMETCIINKSILTNEAIKTRRINNDEAILKPLIELSADKIEVDVSADEIFTLVVNITDTLEDETFTEVNIYVEDAVFTVNLINNQGSINIELTDIGKYWIECKDDGFRSEHLQVEAV